MKLAKLFDDDRAVSPVIGVILMVAITVILAAVIGTFVLGLGDQVQKTTPQASFGFETTNGSTNATITHESGDTITSSDIQVKATENFDSAAGSGQSSASWADIANGDGEVSAGDSVSIAASDGDISGATVRVVYDSPDSDSSATLAKNEF